MFKKWHLLLLIIALLTVSCKKEQPGDVIPTPLRVKKIIYYAPTDPYGTTAEAAFTYNSDKVVQIDWTNTDPFGTQPNQKTVFTYSAGQITKDVFNLHNLAWLPYARYEFLFSGSRLTEDRLYFPNDAGWQQYNLRKYQYSGDNLTLRTEYRSSGDSLIPWYTEEYEYMDDLLVEVHGMPGIADTLASLVREVKTILNYHSGQLTQRVDSTLYAGHWLFTRSYGYTFSEQLVSSIGFNYYTYSSPGVLGKDTEDKTFASKTYQYEQGSGNYALCLKFSDIKSYLFKYPGTCNVP